MAFLVRRYAVPVVLVFANSQCDLHRRLLSGISRKQSFFYSNGGYQFSCMNDVLGQAQTDYYHKKSTEKLWLYIRLNRGLDGHKPDNNNFYDCPKGEMPVEIYFRSREKMPEVELKALELCRGRILDIGAGAGCHSLVLQQMGQDVTALEFSPLSAELLKEQGIKKVICQDFFSLDKGAYDTLLLLWNGIGLTGTISGLRRFLANAGTLLQPGGQILFDSTDCAYVFTERPSLDLPYYGETYSKYEYKNQASGWLEWLFIDRHTLEGITEEEGWEIEVLAENDIRQSLGQYLVSCRRR
jgi:SAM-dependent methyltransferase